MGTYPTSLALYGPKEGPSQANARPQGIDKGLTRDQPKDHREEVLRSHDMIKIRIFLIKVQYLLSVASETASDFCILKRFTKKMNCNNCPRVL